MVLNFPRLRETVKALGADNHARARTLGVSTRTITAYVNGTAFPDVAVIARNLILLEVFCAEARAAFHSSPNQNDQAA